MATEEQLRYIRNIIDSQGIQVPSNPVLQGTVTGGVGGALNALPVGAGLLGAAGGLYGAFRRKDDDESRPGAILRSASRGALLGLLAGVAGGGISGAIRGNRGGQVLRDAMNLPG